MIEKTTASYREFLEETLRELASKFVAGEVSEQEYREACRGITDKLRGLAD